METINDLKVRYMELYDKHNDLKQQLADAEKALDKMNDKVVGREYGLDAEEIWEITREYKSKYKFL